MKTKRVKRRLSDSFMKDLEKSGALNPILNRVLRDTSLTMEIRSDYVNVYYRGGSLLRISEKRTSEYEFKFDEKYVLKGEINRISAGLDMLVSTQSQAESWRKEIPFLKDTMDLWFGAHPKEEREFQQVVVRDNNIASVAGGTDYFIIDIEYDNHDGARFDLVAVEWESKRSSRKLNSGYTPKLVMIEMKYGVGALSSNSGSPDKKSPGILKHMEDFIEFSKDRTKVAGFMGEMGKVLEQKRELGLIPALKGNKKPMENFQEDIGMMFLLANHNPRSGLLKKELHEVSENYADFSDRLLFCFSNYMGYGIYNDCVLTLREVMHDKFIRPR